jgi:uncharacterized phage-like protein YoqJ
MVTFGFTGHRFIPRYFLHPEIEKKAAFKALATFFSKVEKPYKFIIGMAQGFDSLVALYAMQNNIPFDIKVPFPLEMHCKGWPQEDKMFLLESHKKAESVHVTSQTFHTQAYQRRNEQIVNNCDILLSWYTKSASGSGNCVTYARSKEKPIFHLRKWYHNSIGVVERMDQFEQFKKF